jgi:hypothetical protein
MAFKGCSVEMVLTSCGVGVVEVDNRQGADFR